MRPLKLTVEGFTAFREVQELDFADLDLFAIVGPTGSGKSSLLDALTFALYGKVARLEDTKVTERALVSQGLPWMKVMLEFAVGRERYRVTRRIPGFGTSGQSKVLLEVHEGGDYRQAGEGADRVREANARIEQLVGLEYPGFTRSVLLPQGKFAEFLTGRADERRRLLNDLLDLWLFERMGKRARRIADDAATEADTVESLLAKVYADATPEALKAAKQEAAGAKKAEAALAKARAAVAKIVERSREDERAVDELRACAAEVDRMADGVRAAGEKLERLASDAAGAERASREAASALAEMEAALAEATAAREGAERASGTEAALAEARATARQRADLLVQVADETAALDAVRATVPELAAAVEAASEGLASAETALAEATQAAERAEQALESARHDDLVAEVSRGLKVGDPCPVCGSPLEALPEAPGAARLEAVRTERDAAASGATAARERRDRAREAVAAAERAMTEAEAEVKRGADAVAKLERRAGELATALAAVLGDELPDDPAAEVERRLAALAQLKAAEAAATKAVTAAREAGTGAERERARLLQLIAAEAARLDVDAAPMLRRATAVAKDLDAPALPGPAPAHDEAEKLVAFAADVRGALGAFAGALRSAADVRASGEAKAVDEARDAVRGLGVEGDSLADLAAATEAAYLAARDALGSADGRVELLGRQLAERAEHEATVKEHRDRARRFAALAAELRADRIVDHLQGEALKLLCAAGSTHLARLSGGRYRFVYEGDEFTVVDTENGDERRSVRTLSGGETFLASLALALALSEEVRSLSVTEKAPLESLFLDEGFGTLDPDTLETVAGAIEQLGVDGRLVGIVTHVKELADRLPTRVQVTRTGNASSLSVVH